MTLPTHQSICALETGKFTTLSKIAPTGSLQARKQADGAVTFCWRFTHGAHSERVAIGVYDSSAPPRSIEATKRGYSIAAAVRAAELLALEHHRHRDQGGRPALVQAQRDERQRAAEAKTHAQQHTLEALLDDYCDHLEKIGRSACRDARSIFKLHVKERWPKIAALPAKDVTPEQVADMMRTLVEAGKGRTGNKLRSYMRAAYALARSAATKASVPVAFKAFRITINPAADTSPDETANRADRNPLTLDEMRTYWDAIKEMPGFRGALLRLHLTTGAQRIEQLVNLRAVDIEANVITLHDGKGRPGKPARAHAIPLGKEARKALDECKPAGDEFALSTDAGKTHVAATTLSAWAKETVGEAIPDFQAKRLRSGVETLLAAAGVSAEIRGRLQSHGISGVQARHYDGWGYMPEKTRALAVLMKQLTQPKAASNVTPMHRRAAKKA